MNVRYILIDESVHCINKLSNDEIKTRLNTFFEICNEILKYSEEEALFYSINIYSQQIGDTEFADWLYNGEDEEWLSDEKKLLRIFLEQSFEMIEVVDECLANLHLPYYAEINTAALHMLLRIEGIPDQVSIYIKEDCFKVRKHFLMRGNDRYEFYKDIRKTFPNLYFGEEVESSLRHYNPLRDHIKELVKHLSALNDYGQSIYEANSNQGENVVLQILSSATGIICSPEGDPERVEKYLRFRFKFEDKGFRDIRCSPHTKLYRANSDYRIYFTWNTNQLPGLPFILIGHIGGHPY